MGRVGLGEDRVVEIARILAVDGDQRHLSKVEAVAHWRCLGVLGLAGSGLGELYGNVVGRDRDQADRTRVAHRPDTFDHAGAA